MKKLFVVSVVALAVVFTLSSTSVYAQGLTGAGVKAGLNLASAWGDDVEPMLAMAAQEMGAGEYKKKMKIGAAFGGFIVYSVNDKFAVQPELLYTMKGVKGEADVYGEKAKGEIKLNYLEIPVLAKVSISTAGKVKPVLLLGPALALKLSAKAKGEIDGEGGTDDISDDVKGIDFGLVVGAGVDVELASGGKVTVDGRYTLGLTNVPDIEEVDGDIEVKNAVISVMVGYCFAL